MNTVPQSNIGDRVNYGLNGNGNGSIPDTTFHMSSVTGDTFNNAFLQDYSGMGEHNSGNNYQNQNYGDMVGLQGNYFDVLINE